MTLVKGIYMGLEKHLCERSDPEFMDLVQVMEAQDILFGAVTSSEYFLLAVLLGHPFFL